MAAPTTSTGGVLYSTDEQYDEAFVSYMLLLERARQSLLPQPKASTSRARSDALNRLSMADGTVIGRPPSEVPLLLEAASNYFATSYLSVVLTVIERWSNSETGMRIPPIACVETKNFWVTNESLFTEMKDRLKLVSLGPLPTASTSTYLIPADATGVYTEVRPVGMALADMIREGTYDTVAPEAQAGPFLPPGDTVGYVSYGCTFSAAYPGLLLKTAGVADSYPVPSGWSASSFTLIDDEGAPVLIQHIRGPHAGNLSEYLASKAASCLYKTGGELYPVWFAPNLSENPRDTGSPRALAVYLALTRDVATVSRVLVPTAT
jgi:hypothetical protein